MSIKYVERFMHDETMWKMCAWDNVTLIMYIIHTFRVCVCVCFLILSDWFQIVPYNNIAVFFSFLQLCEYYAVCCFTAVSCCCFWHFCPHFIYFAWNCECLLSSCLDLLKWRKKQQPNGMNDWRRQKNTFQSIDLCLSFIFYDLISTK